MSSIFFPALKRDVINMIATSYHHHCLGNIAWGWVHPIVANSVQQFFRVVIPTHQFSVITAKFNAYLCRCHLWYIFFSRSCQCIKHPLGPPEPTLWLLSRIMSDQSILQTKTKTKVLQKTDIIEIGGKHLVMKTRLVRYGNVIMRNVYWRSNMEICLQRDVEILCYDANMMQIIGSIFVCQQCRLIMDEKRAIRFESMACT